MALTQSDAHLMALKQCLTLGRQRIADCINDLEDALAERDLHAQQDKLVGVVLSLKYTTDFILGDPSP
jgi:citrate lyase beta subunit